MIRTRSRDYAWNKGWIEFEAPNAQGVYWLRAKDGQTIFVGKGNIRQRLLSHWDHEKPGDLAIWDHNPATFAFGLAARCNARFLVANYPETLRFAQGRSQAEGRPGSSE